MKICKKCNKSKRKNEFYSNLKRKDKKSYYCKECIKSYINFDRKKRVCSLEGCKNEFEPKMSKSVFCSKACSTKASSMGFKGRVIFSENMVTNENNKGFAWDEPEIMFA